MTDDEREYEIALSFAGEQRAYVEQVAAGLRESGVRVFYDAYEQVGLWGKDLHEHLDYVYQRAAQYVVVFASSDYAEKAWTTHERKSAQARAIQEKAEYILPARFDHTEVPGIRSTVGYIDLRRVTPRELVELIVEKLGPRRTKKFFPNEPRRLYAMLDLGEGPDTEWTKDLAREFFGCLLRMSKEERLLLFELFAEACNSQLPANVHIELDLLRRISAMPSAEVLSMLRGLSSLGVTVKAYVASDEDANDHSDEMIAVSWESRMVYDEPDRDNYDMERSTEVARAVLLGCSADYCRACAHEALEVLDLSALALPVNDGER